MSTAMKWKKLVLNVANGATISAAFQMEPWAIFLGVLFPDIDAGDVNLHVSLDGGTTYHPILDPLDGADAVLLTSGSDPGWIDFSDWVRFVPDNTLVLMRFVMAAQTSGAIDVIVFMRG